MGGDAAALADSPLLFPDDATRRTRYVFADLPAGARPADHRPLRHDHRGLSDGRAPPPTTGPAQPAAGRRT